MAVATLTSKLRSPRHLTAIPSRRRQQHIAKTAAVQPASSPPRLQLKSLLFSSSAPLGKMISLTGWYMLPRAVQFQRGDRTAFLVSFLGMLIIIIMSVVLSTLSRNGSRNLLLKRINGTKKKKSKQTQNYICWIVSNMSIYTGKSQKSQNRQTGSDIAVCYFGGNLSSTRSFASPLPPSSGRSQPNCLLWVILTALEAANHLTAPKIRAVGNFNICYDASPS